MKIFDNNPTTADRPAGAVSDKAKYLPPRGWKRLLVLCAYAALAVGALWLLLRVALPLFMPFAVAWVASLFAQPLVNAVCRRTRLPRKAVSAVLVLLILGLAGGGLVWLFNRVVAELGGLLTYLGEHDVPGALRDTFDRLAERFPILRSVAGEGDYLYGALSGALNGAVSAVSAKLPELAGKLAARLPELIFFTVVLVMSAFYICADFQRVGAGLLGLLPEAASARIKKLKTRLKSTGSKYLRAYLCILLVTFAELVTGFLILRIDYAVTIALVTAALDILPVIGVGTVLIPWACWLLLTGSWYQGFGLLILYGAVTLIRQVIEPRIVGASIGLSPLATLVSMYAGFKLMGIVGMLILPAGVIVGKTLLDGGKAD